jgi:hypothetical protein
MEAYATLLGELLSSGAGNRDLEQGVCALCPQYADETGISCR